MPAQSCWGSIQCNKYHSETLHRKYGSAEGRNSSLWGEGGGIRDNLSKEKVTVEFIVQPKTHLDMCPTRTVPGQLGPLLTLALKIVWGCRHLEDKGTVQQTK